VGTNGDGVKLPTAVAGLEILIINDDAAQTLKIWPATGDAIDGGSANAVDANQLAAGSSRRYIAVDATNWYTATVAVDVADNSITLAKMAGGTDGNIISYDASGDPVAVATGDDGQVLTSAGAGQPPAFEAAAGGGGKILQVQSMTYTTRVDNNTDTFVATGLTDTITCASTSNKVLITGAVTGCYKAGNVMLEFRMTKGGSNLIQIIDMHNYSNSSDRMISSLPFAYVDSPSSTSELTYAIEFRSYTDEATISVQQDGTAAAMSFLVLMEIDGT
jgi:hypothetical protein